MSLRQGLGGLGYDGFDIRLRYNIKDSVKMFWRLKVMSAFR